jgi:uncharacterized membrane protein YfcA
MFEVSLEILFLLLAAEFAAGFIDAVVGGGGLITVPVLLLAGANPVTALATNKVKGVFGAATAALSYAHGGHVNLRSQLLPAIIAFFASVAGALLTFAFVATPWWMTGLAMGVAQIFGARLGAALAQKIGVKLIKPLLVVTSLALAIKLLWDMF